LRLAALALVTVAACSRAPVASTSASIIGGTRDSGDPSVVMLVSYPPDRSTFYTCTASLIAPTVLVTAAHCIDAANHPSYLFGAFFGDDPSVYANLSQLEPHLAPAAAVHPHPQYSPTAPFTADIGVVVLQAAATPAPLLLRRAPLDGSIVGAAARLVGYGQTVYGQFNAQKYQAATSVASLPGDDTVVVGDATHRSCVGDSGGPALVVLGGVESIIGVDSYTNTTGCIEPAHYRRVDAYLTFLDTWAPPPAPADLGGAPPVDASAPPADLARAAALDLGTSPGADLATPPGADLATLPGADLATPSVDAGGCRAVPGRPSPWAALALLFAAQRSSRRRRRAPAIAR
jgi:secreted trypsin-like serine protease